MKKIFRFKRVTTATATIEVCAESVEDALAKAMCQFNALSHCAYVIEPISTNIIGEEETPDFDELEAQAKESIRAEFSEPNNCISFLATPVLMDYTNTFGEIQIFYDEAFLDEYGEIWLVPEDPDLDDIEFSDISEPDKLRILRAIINRD